MKTFARILVLEILDNESRRVSQKFSDIVRLVRFVAGLFNLIKVQELKSKMFIVK